jgi:hypothetical protein
MTDFGPTQSTMPATTPDAAAQPRIRDSMSACPDCGGPLLHSASENHKLTCPECGGVQQIEKLSPAAAARQQDHLHERGMDRLTRAIHAR